MVNAPEGHDSFSAELVDAADNAANRNKRSTTAQLEHWARVGRAITEGTPARARRAQRPLAGELGREDLCPTDTLIFDAVVDAGISSRMAATNYAEQRAALGLSSMALNSNGEIVEQFPDGTTRNLPGD